MKDPLSISESGLILDGRSAQVSKLNVNMVYIYTWLYVFIYLQQGQRFSPNGFQLSLKNRRSSDFCPIPLLLLRAAGHVLFRLKVNKGNKVILLHFSEVLEDLIIVCLSPS
jgi:hypothetical protein